MCLISFVAIVFTALYLLNKHFLSYWRRLGIPQSDTEVFFGNGRRLFMRQLSFLDFFEDIYKKTKSHRFFGIYMFYKPILVINDPKLAQGILVKDFTTFHDRPMPADAAEYYPLFANLFNMRGQKWRDLRTRLTPAFTAGRLRAMVPIQKTSTEVLLNYVHRNIRNGNDILDFKDTLARYSLSTISSIGFGIDNDCINEPDNLFRKVSLMVFEMSVRSGIANFLMFFAPDLFTKLKVIPFPPEVSPFIFSMVTQTIEYREMNNYSRNDFMDLLIKLKNQGYLPADKESEDGNEDEWEQQQTDVDKTKRISMDEVAAQAFVFTIGGFETISSCMHLCLFELSRNPKIQRKLQKEIDDFLTDNDEITYDLLADMRYLDCCISETLRKYPLAGLLNRVSSTDYKIPNSDVTIEKRTSIFIPFVGLQRDPEYYANPLEFKPERFEGSSNGSANVMEGIAYAPFGDGPRHCIGMRMAKIQVKYGLAKLLSQFNFELHDKSQSQEEIQFNPKYLVLTPMKPILLKISTR